MTPNRSISEEGLNILKAKLELSSNASFQFERPLFNRYSIGPDLIIEDNNRIFIVEFKQKASWNALAQLTLYQRLLDSPNITLVLAARVIPDNIREAADRIHIIILQLPYGVPVQKDEYKPRGKFTSEKAWIIITYLLKERVCSIRSISQSENISYGWTHSVIKNLISRGIVEQRQNVVELVNIEGLINAVAWERPINDLKLGEINTSFEDHHNLARTLTQLSESWESDLVLGVYTAATLHYGYGIRHDVIYCYVSSNETFDRINKEIGEKETAFTNRVKLIVLKSDRDVFRNAQIIDGVKVTSPEQTLLDVAGLGYSSKDIINDMVKKYGSNSR